MNRKYSPEMRERALRMLAETRPSHPTMMSAVRHVAGLLGMSPETLRLSRRRRPRPVCPAAEGRASRPRGGPAACGELRRLRAAEDARADASAGVAGRPRPDRTPHAA